MSHIYMPHNQALKDAIERAATYLAQGSDDMQEVARIVEAGLQRYARSRTVPSTNIKHKHLRLVVNNERGVDPPLPTSLDGWSK